MTNSSTRTTTIIPNVGRTQPARWLLSTAVIRAQPVVYLYSTTESPAISVSQSIATAGKAFGAYIALRIWVLLRENEELAVGQHHTGSAAAGTFGRAGLSLRLTFGVVRLPA